jgi:hypothetical protein
MEIKLLFLKMPYSLYPFDAGFILVGHIPVFSFRLRQQSFPYIITDSRCGHAALF